MAVDTHRWNVERDGSDLLICEGDHEKHEGCTYARYVPATTHQRTLEALREATEALERLVELTPVRANARDARDMHLTVKAIADAALARIKEATDGR